MAKANLDRAQAAQALHRFMTALDERPSHFLLDGETPVLRRAVFLFGSALVKTQGLSDVDVLLIYYAPGVWSWSKSLLEIECGDSDLSLCGYEEIAQSSYAAFRKIRRADIPRRKHLHSIAQDGLSPSDVFGRERGEGVGTLKQVLPLWTRTDGNWREKVDRFENGSFLKEIVAPPRYTSVSIFQRDLPEDVARQLKEQGKLHQFLYALNLWANWSYPPDDLDMAPSMKQAQQAQFESNLASLGLTTRVVDSWGQFSVGEVNRF